MTNLECAIAVLLHHREARAWQDHAVATDLLNQLGLDHTADAPHAAPIVNPAITEDEVVAAERVAKESADKARAARDALNAQREPEETDQAKQQRYQAQIAEMQTQGEPQHPENHTDHE